MASVLVVDDHLDTAHVIVRLLRRSGHFATCVTRGADAMPSLIAARPDLVLLDMMMPEMNGIDVLHLIRASPEYRTLPVLAYSAAEEWRQAALNAGAHEFVLKADMQWDALRAVIERLAASPMS